jgi:hypothetical protein
MVCHAAHISCWIIIFNLYGPCTSDAGDTSSSRCKQQWRRHQYCPGAAVGSLSASLSASAEVLIAAGELLGKARTTLEQDVGEAAANGLDQVHMEQLTIHTS